MEELKPDRLWTLPTHIACNNSYKDDEEYFIETMRVEVRNTDSGAALHVDFIHRVTKRDESRRLFGKNVREMRWETWETKDARGRRLVAVDREEVRVRRVLVKILRGLFFRERGILLPEDLVLTLDRLFNETDELPPMLLAWLRTAVGEGGYPYPTVFEYRLKAGADSDDGREQWAFRLWEGLWWVTSFTVPESPSLPPTVEPRADTTPTPLIETSTSVVWDSSSAHSASVFRGLSARWSTRRRREARRNRRGAVGGKAGGVWFALVLVGYFDESGTGPESRSFTLAGYIATQETWVSFPRRWDAVLRKHGIAQFHASEIRNFKEGRELLALMTDLIDVTVDHTLWNFAVGIKWDDYRAFQTAHHETLGGEAWGRHPYYLCFHLLLSKIAEAMCRAERAQDVEAFGRQQAHAIHERVALIFEQTDEFQGEAKRIYKDLHDGHMWPGGKRLGALSFEGKEVQQLQLADLLAWETRRHVDRRDQTTQRGSFRRLRKQTISTGYLEVVSLTALGELVESFDRTGLPPRLDESDC